VILAKYWPTLSRTGSVVYGLYRRYLEGNSQGPVLSSKMPCVVGGKQKKRERG